MDSAFYIDKIVEDKLLAKMEERDADILLDADEECVVCLGARATMQTFPCEHRVVCRKCFIRTIQVAVAQRSLPLRCVVCRTRILKLRHASAAPGSSPVSVGTESPFHSSSAPPRITPHHPHSHPPQQQQQQHQHSHEGFIVHRSSSSSSSSSKSKSKTSVIRSHKLHAVTSLGKIAPCRDHAREITRTTSPFFVPDPPRVTLTSSASSANTASSGSRTSGQFSPLVKSPRRCPGRREASAQGLRVVGAATAATTTTTSASASASATIVAAVSSVKSSKPAVAKVSLAAASSHQGGHPCPVATQEESGHRPQQTQHCSSDWRRKD